MLHIAPSGKSVTAAHRWETPCEVMFYLSEDTVSLLSHACRFFYLMSRGIQQQLPRHDVGGGGQSEGLKRATNLTLNFGVEQHFLAKLAKRNVNGSNWTRYTLKWLELLAGPCTFLGHFLEREWWQINLPRDLSQVQQTFVGAVWWQPLEKCYTAIDFFDNNRDTGLIKNYSLW